MEEFLPLLSASPLFLGMSGDQILSMLACLSPRRKAFEKGAFILREGEATDAFGFVLAGHAHVIQEDFWGNRNLLTDIAAGEIFAESYACSQGVPLGVNVVALEYTLVLFLDVHRALSTCSAACAFHNALIRNLVALLASKNLLMNEKLQHITHRSTREKLLSFLSAQSAKAGTGAFEIPFNRQQLADYLSVDRSAMSGELCRLRDEGILRFHRSRFELCAKTEQG